MKSILVTCYENPDLDCVACAIAYSEFLQKTGKPAVAAIFGFFDEVHSPYQPVPAFEIK